MIPSSTWTALNKGGPLGLLAAGLLYIVYLIAVSGQDALASKLDTVAGDTNTLIQEHTSFVEVVKQSETEARRQTILLQKICINAADTNTERKDCLLLE